MSEREPKTGPRPYLGPNASQRTGIRPIYRTPHPTGRRSPVPPLLSAHARGLPPPDATPASPGDGAANTLKILFVDDEPDLVPLIRQRFRSQIRAGEVALVFAADGVEALEHLRGDPEIEVVVTDINMPRMDGLTLLGELPGLGRRTRAVVVTAYGDMENIRTAMNKGAFDFLTKPIDMEDLQITLGQAREAVEHDREADRIRRLLSTQVSDKIAQWLIDHPDALDRTENREVSVLMSDLSGFSQLAERLAPERVVELLNVYLRAMTEVVDAYDGAIDEFIGDAVLAIFGAPPPMPDHAVRATACAVAMQQKIAEVNATLGERGLPALEMTAAVNSGEVVVGQIGSAKRAKYGVVGSAVNMTGRLQSLAVSGEVLISDSTYRAAGGAAGPIRLDGTRKVSVKGFAEPIDIHSVAAVEGVGGGDVPDTEAALAPLPRPVPFDLAVLDGKEVTNADHAGQIVALSATGAQATIPSEIDARTDVRLSFRLADLGADGDGTTSLYAKVVGVTDAGDGQCEAVLRFSSVPPVAADAFARLAG